MKYSMVKQFSNAALDNAFKFMFKIVDFGKIMYEALWMFLDIWIAFYLIFHNIFLYFYYIFLYAIDRGADESRYTIMFWKKAPKSVSRTPEVLLSSAPNPIPMMYRATARKTTEAVSQAVTATSGAASKLASAASEASDVVFSSTSRGRKSTLKSIAEAVSNFFYAIKKLLVKPFESIIDFFNNKMKPVREDQQTTEQKSKSLIDEYLKEYERKKK